MPQIEHIVVLMLENRSFDCVFGRLYPKSDGFDGLDGRECHPWHKADGTVADVPVWNDATVTPKTACIPDSDPGELFEDLGPERVAADTWRPSHAEVEAHARRRHNHHQRALRGPAVGLPGLAAAVVAIVRGAGAKIVPERRRRRAPRRT